MPYINDDDLCDTMTYFYCVSCGERWESGQTFLTGVEAFSSVRRSYTGRADDDRWSPWGHWSFPVDQRARVRELLEIGALVSSLPYVAGQEQAIRDIWVFEVVANVMAAEAARP